MIWKWIFDSETNCWVIQDLFCILHGLYSVCVIYFEKNRKSLFRQLNHQKQPNIARRCQALLIKQWPTIQEKIMCIFLLANISNVFNLDAWNCLEPVQNTVHTKKSLKFLVCGIGNLKILNDTNLILNDQWVTQIHLGSIWYHLELSEVPYSTRNWYTWEIFFLSSVFWFHSSFQIRLIRIGYCGQRLGSFASIWNWEKKREKNCTIMVMRKMSDAWHKCILYEAALAVMSIENFALKKIAKHLLI